MINDDELILYFYRDGLDAARRAEIAQRLNSDAAVSARYCELVAELDRLGQVPEVPVPELTLARWKSRLARAAATTPRPQSSLPMWAFAAATLVLGVAIGLGLNRNRESDATDPPQIATVAESAAEPSALARGARLQLVRADAQLAAWDTATPDARRALVGEWLAQNRALARAADAGGDPALARSLRALESTLGNLLVVADARGDSANLREQLAFEWAVTQTKLATSPSKPVLQL
jgi:hypothetical protein